MAFSVDEYELVPCDPADFSELSTGDWRVLLTQAEADKACAVALLACHEEGCIAGTDEELAQQKRRLAIQIAGLDAWIARATERAS